MNFATYCTESIAPTLLPPPWKSITVLVVVLGVCRAYLI